MATTKRERQRANREQRLKELKRQQSLDKAKKQAIRWSKIVVLILAVFIVSNLVVANCGDEPATTTTTTLVETTETP